MRTQVPYTLVPKYFTSACVIKVVCTCTMLYILQCEACKQAMNSKQFVYNSDIGSFHLKSPKKSANLNGSDPDFDESAYIWSL